MTAARTTGPAVRHAVLRTGEAWLGADLDGLVASATGELRLRRVPGVSPPSLRPAGETAPSGLALDRACGLFVADTAGNRVLRVGLDCGERVVLPCQDPPAPLPATFDQPAGLAVGPFGWLLVADRGSGRILVFAIPELSLRAAWSAGLVEPVGVAGDGDLWVLVLDAGTRRLRRFDPSGRPDNAFDGRLAVDGPADPRAIAVDGDGVLYVADAASATVQRFGRDSRPAGAPLAPGLQGRALAVAGGVLYVADAASGEVVLFSLPTGRRLGTVAGFRGPVAALAAAGAGHLYLKPNLGGDYLAADPDAAFVPRGVLTLAAGTALDAGADTSWLRVAVSGAAADSGSIGLETAVADQPGGPPTWVAAAAPETLVAPGRFLWLRVTVATRDPVASPVLRQVEAETGGDSYLDHLPAVYARDPATSDFLFRLLELARSRLGGLETAIVALPRRFDAETAPADVLDQLAGWQAFQVPTALAGGRRPGELRTLLARLPELHRRRGTPAGLADLVEIHLGTRPQLLEDFRSRQVWLLGQTSALGFDTALPAAGGDGLVVGEAVVGESRPEPADAWGRDLFADTAHRFTVVLPSARVPNEPARRALRRVLDAERPAHTDYHLCLPAPSFRVGLQARVGVDAIVAGPGPGLVLDDSASLGFDARLPDDPPGSGGSVGRRDRIGIDTRLG